MCWVLNFIDLIVNVLCNFKCLDNKLVIRLRLISYNGLICFRVCIEWMLCWCNNVFCIVKCWFNIFIFCVRFVCVIFLLFLFVLKRIVNVVVIMVGLGYVCSVVIVV